jgi:replicative DNA helicase
MDAERSLISKAVQTAQIEKLLTKGVDDSYFYNEECREVWNTCVNHIRTYRSSPSFEAVRKSHPEFAFEISTDSLDYLLDEFTKQSKRRAAINGLREIARAVDDPSRILDIDSEILELGSSLAQMFPTGNSQRFSEMEKRILTYDQRAIEGFSMGIPFGIEALDDLTLGIQPHEFVNIVGWQGTGKSTLTQYICFNAYLSGRTALIISLEMEAEAMLRKFDVMATNFQYQALKKLELGTEDRRKWEQWAERAAKLDNDIIIIDDIKNCTVEKVHSIAEQYKPDIMAVDYISLMDAPRQFDGKIWEKVTHLTQGLKRIARDPKCPPILSVAQTNIGGANDGAKLDNIAYSRSIGQDSDIVLGLHQDDKMKALKKMEVRMLKNRDGSTIDVDMLWDMERMYFRPWTSMDIFAPPDDLGETQ